MTTDITTIEELAQPIAAVLLPILNSDDDLKWQAGDILNNGVGSHRQVETGVFAAVSRLLAEQGREVSEGILRSYCRTARAFPAADRHHDVPFSTYRVVAEVRPSAGAPALMAVMLASFKSNNVAPTRRNAQAFFGRPTDSGVSEKGVVDFISRHPEVVTRAVQDYPVIADAARDGLSTPVPTDDDDTPTPLPRPTGPPVNGSLARIATMEKDLRALRSAIPYLRDDVALDQALVRMQALVDGLHECMARAHSARLAA